MLLSSPIILTQDPYGIQLKANGFGHAYTNGNCANRTYSNAELTLSAGAAQNTQYSAPFTPRVFNGALYDNLSGGNYASVSSFGAGCVRVLGQSLALAPTINLLGVVTSNGRSLMINPL